MKVSSDAGEFTLTPDNEVIDIDSKKIIQGYKMISKLLGNFTPKDFTTIVCMVENSTNKVTIALVINLVDGENHSRWAGYELVASKGKIFFMYVS
jgi:predicted transcriptional regulator